ncbi:peroxidasin homolog [Diadema antillarum]|uniref:peroxidasin homolog n=1 Tax=Diadema antillarum TaxID=105358 RepID=UPI003A84C53F
MISTSKCSIFVIFILTLNYMDCFGAAFKFGPTDTVLVEGKTAVLRCSVKNQGNEVVYWFHVDTGQYISYDENIYSFVMENRYSIIGDHKRGEYFLTIRDARKSDKGEYRCVFGNKFLSARMVVLVPPVSGSPTCEVQPAAEDMTPGKTATLTCTSQGGDPPAELSWYREDKLIKGPSAHSNSIQRLVEEEDNGVLFTCSATTPALTYPRTCSVMVLKNKPVVELTPPEISIKHGETAQFTCRGTGVPKVTDYRWFVNYVTVGSRVSSPRYTLDKTNTTLTIHNVQAWENGVVVSCEASITSGLKGRASSTLTVKLPPNFRTKPPPTSTNNDKKGNGTKWTPNGLGPHPFITSNIAAIAGASAGGLVLLILMIMIAAYCGKGRSSNYPSDKSAPGSLRYKTSQQILVEDDFPIYAKPMKVKRLNCEVPELSRPNSNSTTASTAESALTGVSSDQNNGVAIPLCLRPPSLKRFGKKTTSNYERIGFDGPLPLTRPEPMGSESKETMLNEEASRPAELRQSQNKAIDNDSSVKQKQVELVYADLDLVENNNDSSAKQTTSSVSNSDGVAYAKLRL